MIDLSQHVSMCPPCAPVIVCKDKGERREYRAKNRDRDAVCKYQVDGVLITDQTQKKCDFMVINDTKSNVYLIELKGKDLLQATRQLLNSRVLLKDILNMYKHTFYRIVYRPNTHAIRGSEYNRFVAEVGVANIRTETNIMEEDI